jgi:NADH-ubiquinone oxidoreductase chain 2
MEGLSWFNNLILITWQKIAPIILISYSILNNFFIVIIALSIFIGSVGGLNQTSLRKILAFSSINHLGWILAAILFSENYWITYFLIYSFLNFTLIYIFNSFKIFHINQTFSLFSNFPIIKFFIFISFLSLGGLPPFLGFLPKWLVIQRLTANGLISLVIFMVCLTLLTLFYYLQICYSAFMLNYWEINWNYAQFSQSFNLSISLIFSFISIAGLILFNLFFIIF